MDGFQQNRSGIERELILNAFKTEHPLFVHSCGIVPGTAARSAWSFQDSMSMDLHGFMVHSIKVMQLPLVRQVWHTVPEKIQIKFKNR